ncbi:hypothetical protein EES43_13740 [Streptomyces sp. ADI96-02]|nr:hypothetical protein EES43_13740 [Streptomyces sp. ADI96-02]
MSGPRLGIIERWSPSDSSRSVSAAPALASAWASIRATVESTARSSGENPTGCRKPAIQAPITRPEETSGRKAQDRRPKRRASGQVVG